MSANSHVMKFGDGDTIQVTLQWVWSSNLSHLICQLLFQERFASQLDPQKSYRLAVAMKDAEHYLEWKSFAIYDTVRQTCSFLVASDQVSTPK